MKETTALSGAKHVMTTAIKPIVSELTLTCSDGVALAAQQWTLPHQSDTQNHLPMKNILCIHGWMDNCASFHRLAPRLLEQLESPLYKTNLVALDLPGHGWSSHRSIDAPPTVLSESVFYVAEAVRLLDWRKNSHIDESGGTAASHDVDAPLNDNKFTLIGHSMGAAVSSIYAAAFSNQVNRLVLLEGAAPLPRQSKDVVHHVKAHVERRQASLLSDKKPRVYPNLEAAIHTRRMTATKFPGNQYLSEEAARDLVARGTLPSDDGFVFRHDHRLQWPTIQYWTYEMNRGLYQSLQASSVPTCLLLAEDGWPRSEADVNDMQELLQPQMVETLPGSHHFHADPDTAQVVANHVAAFLRQDQSESDHGVDEDTEAAAPRN
ncbi:hypothetical protein MPSEU_000335900 [Mayamaea pseudoterrestris]|nr:hypothetical protein MPSEU_000335900 [Mayamaea pseudoterrestris]